MALRVVEGETPYAQAPEGKVFLPCLCLQHPAQDHPQSRLWSPICEWGFDPELFNPSGWQQRELGSSLILCRQDVPPCPCKRYRPQPQKRPQLPGLPCRHSPGLAPASGDKGSVPRMSPVLSQRLRDGSGSRSGAHPGLSRSVGRRLAGSTGHILCGVRCKRKMHSPLFENFQTGIREH